MLYSYAMLRADQLRQIQALESELGKCLVAFQAQEIEISPLTPDELRRIQQAEEELGLSLVAVAA